MDGKIKMSETDSKKNETKTQRYITDKRETSNLIEDFSQRVRNISEIYLKQRNKRAKFSKDCFIILKRMKFLYSRSTFKYGIFFQ